MGVIKDFFSWSKKERMGVIVLSTFLFVLFFSDIFFNRIYPFKDYSIHPDTLIVYQQLLEELEAELLVEGSKTEPSIDKFNKYKMEDNETKMTMFDPNSLDEEGWRKLGFSAKQSQSIIKYRDILGGFKSKQDLHSSFVIDDKKFKELEPYVQINIKEELIEKKREEYVNDENVVAHVNEVLLIELNATDSVSLLKLKGIGPFYAGKIISYRDQLGGYYSTEQLLEIWKFDTLKLDKIKDQLLVDTLSLMPLRINQDSVMTLYSHPYITWNQAKAIVNYRVQHGR